MSFIRLFCEYLKNPVGIDTLEPRFSWIRDTGERGYRQTGYKLRVASAPELLAEDNPDMWSTGLVESDSCVNIAYAGKLLRSDRQYYWQVCVRDQHGELSPWSEVATFRTGLFSSGDWEGRWIGAAGLENRSPLVRHEFSLSKEVACAYAYVSGLGFFQFFANGKRVDNHALGPAMTAYRRRVFYTTVDLTAALHKGTNAIGFWLGEGVAAITKCDSSRALNKVKACPGPLPSPQAILQLNITYTDGTFESVVSDCSWTTSEGPLTFHNFYGGENYDARMEQPGWAEPGFDDRKWERVVIKSDPGVLRSELMPPMRNVQRVQPVHSSGPQDGVYVFDLGQNIGGWWRVHVQGPRGVTLKIRGSETLDDETFPKPLRESSRISFDKHHGPAYYERDCISYYTLRGGSKETYEPSFFYSGFRYIQVAVDPEVNLEMLEVEGCVISSALDRAGEFACSQPLMNGIHTNTVWSIRNVLQSIPASNPHSEKYGWTGDAHLVAEHGMYNFEMARFWLKWLDDIRDAQEIEGAGCVPDTVPNYRVVKGPATPAWGTVYPLILWFVYQHYGDERALREHYPGIKAWCDYLAHTAEDNILYWGRGDHKTVSVSPRGEPKRAINQTPEIVPLTSTAYYYRTIQTVARVAGILGYERDRHAYSELAEQVKNAFHHKFFDPENSRYVCEVQPQQYFPFQTCNAVALESGLVPSHEEDAVLNRLVEDITETHGVHLATGVLGTKAVVQVLMNYGRHNVLYRLATQTSYPSWGYWINNGATSLWQDWTGEDDHNHAMFGVIDKFFFEKVGGIGTPSSGTSATGFRRITIHPFVPADMAYGESWMATVRGKVRCAWQKEKRAVHFEIEIPPNTPADVMLPTTGFSKPVIEEGGFTVWSADGQNQCVTGVSGVNIAREGLQCSVEAGSYAFTVREGE